MKSKNHYYQLRFHPHHSGNTTPGAAQHFRFVSLARGDVLISYQLWKSNKFNRVDHGLK